MANSLALCMMVKNEQQFLPYCLASVQKICDEIIVVDTGSTDRSIEIAEAFGAYVIQAKWKDDFALIRNIAQAPAKSDWVIWLDGDEVLNDSGAKKIKSQLLQDTSADFFLLPRVNYWHSLKKVFAYPDSQYKLYRNNINAKWKGKLHEKIFDENNPHHKRRLKHTDVHTFHYAYIKSKDEIKHKMQLYIGIENPDMDKRQIEKCSTEHSFFYDKDPPEVQEYHGVHPEIFNRIAVTNSEIKWIDGPTIVKFKKIIPTANVNFAEKVEKIQKDTPPVYKTVKTNLSDEIKDLLSIVIVTHNKVEYLSPCIRDIYNSVHIPFEVIVVDNGSTEQSVLDYLIPFEKEHSNFKFIHLDKNYGFAKGYNEGVKAAKGEWICVSNNDTLTSDGAYERLISHLKNDPSIGIIAPVSNNMHGEHQMVPAPANSTFGDYLGIMDRLNREQGPKCVYSSWIIGCVMVFNRKLLEELATVKQPPRNGILFCEDFPIGCAEDSDLCFYTTHRLQKKLAVGKDCFIYHYGQITLSSVVDNWREIQHSNDIILRKRWPEIFPEKK
jgi:glycosyltransferase involved in cell wall biosynthesis